MNNHKLACVVLMIFIAALVYGTQEMSIKANGSKELTEQARTEAENAALQLKIVETNLIDLENRTAEMRQAYREWLPKFEAIRTPQDGEQQITDFVRDARIFLVSQRFDPTEISKKKDGLITKGLKATLVIEDDYVKTLNWLGGFEEAFPASRVDKCRIIRGERGNNIRMELEIVLPILTPPIVTEPAATPEVASS